LAAALALCCREDAALPVFGLGAWLIVARRRFAWGVLTAAAALIVLFVDVRWIIPSFRGEPYPHLGRYARFGASLGEIAIGLLRYPLRAVGEIVTTDRLAYLGALLAPLALLPLGAPLDLVGALPALAQNLLSSDPILYNHRTQYQAFVLPFLMLAAIGGYARLARRTPGRWPATVIVIAMIASLALASRTVNNLAIERWWPGAEKRAAYPVLASIPRDAAVSAQDPYVPHLSLRSRVAVFPMDIERSDYVLINTGTYPWRALPGVTMSRDAQGMVIAMPDGREYRYAVDAVGGPHTLLRRLR